MSGRRLPRRVVEQDQVPNPTGDYWTCRHRNYSVACILYQRQNPCSDAGGHHPAKDQQSYWCGWPMDYQNYGSCGKSRERALSSGAGRRNCRKGVVGQGRR